MCPEPQNPEEKKPLGEPKTLHKETLELGSRSYTFEYRESARGNRFLNVSDTHERNGKPSRQSILVFEDQLDGFFEGLSHAIEFARKNRK
jgi:hypothetical protein